MIGDTGTPQHWETTGLVHPRHTLVGLGRRDGLYLYGWVRQVLGTQRRVVPGVQEPGGQIRPVASADYVMQNVYQEAKQ